jgi:hypothetical protein
MVAGRLLDGNQAANGLHVSKASGVDISATDHAVDVLVEGWKFTLDWIGHNPLLFLAALLFLVWLVISGRATRIKMAEMKLEYAATRSSVAGPRSVRQPVAGPKAKGDTP